ncbi:U32 family peptidase [Aerosakkonemataceae cyanobacterium BLCC-F154]|uniref:U32 family peptidase n=1 Tax=Floridaenema fluviatile BLCC-F154 TaxID=3153640 RepID=A0ABV4Y6S9_9CYAN
MQFNTFVSSISDLERCVNAPNLQEVLLEPILLARQGKLTENQVQSLAKEALKRGLRPVLVWDILMPERVMNEVCERLKSWDFSQFAAIRVCDPGVAYWLKIYFPKMPLQLIVETGNHNFESLLGWCEIFGESLERLILSIELPEEKLIEYCQKLPLPCELLGVGQILLFYSPRSLLTEPLAAEDDLNSTLYLQANAAFEDAPNRHFPTLETIHGTFMFLDKDQFILDKLQGLESAGLHTVRLDLRHLEKNGDVAVDIDNICCQILEDPASLRLNWFRETRAPFFKANRTTSLFPRMKSKVADYRNQNCLAEVLTGESGKYVVFQTFRSFDVSQIKNMIMPTGEEIKIPPETVFRNINGEQLSTFTSDQILVTNWIKKAVPGTLLLSKG